MRILLDSNAYTQLKRGHSAVGELVRRSEAVLVSTIVAGALLSGLRHGNRYERNQHDFQLFLDSPYVDVVPVSVVTADRYSRVAASLRTKGRPIPTNDIWIAALALEHGLPVVSRDTHFDVAPSVTRRDW